MILYLDASALVKEYVEERGSDEVVGIVARATHDRDCADQSRRGRGGTRARQCGWVWLSGKRGSRIYRRSGMNGSTLSVSMSRTSWSRRADEYTWEFGLRATMPYIWRAASSWQDALGQQVTLATFDRPLWEAAKQTGLTVYPSDLPALLAAWKPGLYDRTLVHELYPSHPRVTPQPFRSGISTLRCRCRRGCWAKLRFAR